MKLFTTTWPHGDAGYASALRRGTWIEASACPECGASLSKRVSPLVIEWEAGATEIGDFVWAAWGSEVIVRRTVFDALVERFDGLSAEPIEMIEDRNARPKRHMVRLPYEGPPLVDLQVTGTGTLDRRRSSVRMTQESCGTCGTETFEAQGLEEFRSRIDKRTGDLIWRRKRRIPGKGLFVDAESHFLRLPEFPAWPMCSERAADHITDAGFTNVAFLEVGDVEVH